MGGRTDAHERRLEVMARALNFGVPLGLYDEIQKPAEIVWGEVLTENARLEARLVAVEDALRGAIEQLDSCVEYMEVAERDGLAPWSIAATTVLAHCKVMRDDFQIALAAQESR